MRLIDPYDFNESAFRMLDKEWMLITAGEAGKFNMMTASWGGFGILWHQPVAFIFVRPQRYTFQFLEEYNGFTLCFFGEECRDILNFCGSISGRNADKMGNSGLDPLVTESGNIYFKEAKLVIECRKIYFQDLQPGNFQDPVIESNYPKKDYHRMYIGSIEKILIKD